MGCVPFEPDFGCCDDWDSYPPELQERATVLAWSTLRGLTGLRVGNCPTTMRPCLGEPCGICLSWSGPGAPNEVHVGLTPPDDTTVELWFDPDAVGPVGPMPAAAAQHPGGKNEVRIDYHNPGGGELWFDPDGRRFRTPTVPAGIDNQTPWMTAYLHNGEWRNVACGGNSCSCEPLCEIVVAGPVAALIDVTLDGCSLPLDAFRVDNGNRIVRQDGQCWPSCQNMARPLGAPGTLGITYVAGIIPDAAGLWAAGVLACEFAKACDPTTASGKCRLPSSVTSIARQGVTMTMGASMFPDGMTGIREVDAYVLSVNPNGLKMPSTVWSPDVPWAKHRYVTPTVRIVP